MLHCRTSFLVAKAVPRGFGLQKFDHCVEALALVVAFDAIVAEARCGDTFVFATFAPTGFTHWPGFLFDTRLGFGLKWLARTPQ
jgi:hypothetical protein